MTESTEEKKFDLRLDYSGYIILLILLMGMFLRIFHLGTRSLWFDEIRTYEDAFKTYNIFSKTHSLYYLIVRFFIFFGHSEFWLRMGSAVFGILSIPVIYLAGKHIFENKWVGISAAFFVAVSRSHLFYSQEARYYAVMFFLTCACLLLFALFYRKRSIAALLALPFVCFLNYFIHPTTLVFSGIILAWVPFSLIVTKRGRDMIRGVFLSVRKLVKPKEENTGKKSSQKSRNKRKRDSSNINFRVVVAVLLLACLLAVGIYSSMKLGRMIFARIKSIQPFRAAPPGVEATYGFFFLQHFIPFGPNVNTGGIIATYIVSLFVIFALTGYIRSILKRFAFGSFFIFTILVTFSLLFSIRLSQWYSSKYVYFLYPVNILCISYGFVSIISFVSGLLTQKLPGKSHIARAVLLILILAPFSWVSAKNVIDYYFDKGINIKGAMKIVADELEAGDAVAAYGVTSLTARYYADRYNIPKDQYVHLKEKGDGARSVYKLLNHAGDGADLWIVFGWPYDLKPYLTAWVEENFDLVKRFKTDADPKNDITLWKWKYVDHFLSNKSEISGLPLAPGDCDIYVHHPMDAIFDFSFPEKSDEATSFSIEVDYNGKQLAIMDLEHTEKTVFLPAGEVSISLEGHNIELASEFLEEFSISPAHPERRYIYAAEYVDSTETYDLESHGSEESSYVKLYYNSFLSYDLSGMDPGRYELSIKAKNDPPGPILLHMEIDNKPCGLLAFDEGDSSWEKKTMPVTLRENSMISVYFISDNFLGKKKEAGDMDNDAFIEYLMLEKDPGIIRDQRIRIDPDLVKDISSLEPVREMNLTDGELPGWGNKSMVNPEEVIYSEGDKKYPALTAFIPPDFKGGNFFTSAIPVQPGRLLYFSVKASVENMNNHSANVMIVCRDENYKIIGRKWLKAQGIMKNVKGEKFICFRGTPEGTSFITIHMSVYHNSRRVHTNPARVWFYDLHSEAPK